MKTHSSGQALYVHAIHDCCPIPVLDSDCSVGASATDTTLLDSAYDPSLDLPVGLSELPWPSQIGNSLQSSAAPSHDRKSEYV